MSDEYFREQQREREKKKEVEKSAKQKWEEERAKIREPMIKDQQQAARNSSARKKWSLYFIAHINDLPNIIEKGILSPNQVTVNPDIHPTRIADRKWQAKRSKKFIHRSELDRNVPLDDYAHTFFFPRNRMLWRIIQENNQKDIVVIKMRLDISEPGLAITLENPAAEGYGSVYESWEYDKIVPVLEELKKKYEITRYFLDDPDPEYKYQLSSECLIPLEVPSNTFEQIHVYSNADTERNVQRLVAASKRPQLKVVQDPRMFFITW